VARQPSTGHADALERMTSKQRKGKPTVGTTDDPAFDHWVARQLHKIYDEVLSEDVPEELLRLVERRDEPAATDDAENREDSPATARKH
jgi:hypothetical protein